MRRLARLLLGEGAEIDDETAALVLSSLPPSELKKLLAELKRSLARARISLTVAGDAGAARAAVTRGASQRALEVTVDEGLGAGVRLRDGDDIIDASVHGYVERIIEELEKR